MQNSDFWTRITSLYESQTWPVVLFMYNSVLSIRKTSLYWSNTSSVVFARKTAWLASELLVSMGPSPHVWILDGKWRLLDRNNKSLFVPDISCIFACTKRQVRFGSHGELLFCSKRRCFASKNHRWGLGPTETSNSDANHAVLQACNDRWGLGSLQTCISDQKVAVLHAKTTNEGWNP